MTRENELERLGSRLYDVDKIVPLTVPPATLCRQMIAVVEIKSRPFPCIVSFVGRKGLKLKILTYCGEQADANKGVRQVPDNHTVCAMCRLKLAIPGSGK